jgi:hypothetical protein
VVGDVGGVGDLVLVPAHELAVARGHEVRLDVVRPLPRAQLVRRQRVLGPVARRATVADDQRARDGGTLAVVVGRRGGDGLRERQNRGEGDSAERDGGTATKVHSGQ